MFYFIMVKKLVANFYVILSLFESCHIGNLTSFFIFICYEYMCFMNVENTLETVVQRVDLTKVLILIARVHR